MTSKDGTWSLEASGSAQELEHYKAVRAFELVYPAEEESLPALWITLPVYDSNDCLVGRDVVGRYPSTDEPDSDGSQALYYGGKYYCEAMTYASAEQRGMRLECFRAAELLYLHAAGKGNPVAQLCLGYVYSYDRCEGSYFASAGTSALPEAPGTESLSYEQRQKRAFDCYSKACEAGFAEAFYKLGDMYRRGDGCTQSDGEAFRCYSESFERGRDGDPVVWGSAAIRLADSFENGYGCRQDFKAALRCYETAEAGLEIGVRNGDWFYKKQLQRARDGVQRIRQELSGLY